MHHSIRSAVDYVCYDLGITNVQVGGSQTLEMGLLEDLMVNQEQLWRPECSDADSSTDADFRCLSREYFANAAGQ